jgi:hypothetical protein
VSPLDRERDSRAAPSARRGKDSLRPRPSEYARRLRRHLSGLCLHKRWRKCVQRRDAHGLCGEQRRGRQQGDAGERALQDRLVGFERDLRRRHSRAGLRPRRCRRRYHRHGDRHWLGPVAANVSGSANVSPSGARPSRSTATSPVRSASWLADSVAGSLWRVQWRALGLPQTRICCGLKRSRWRVGGGPPRSTRLWISAGCVVVVEDNESLLCPESADCHPRVE